METIQVIGTDFDQKAFDKVAIHPLQTWEWGEAKEKLGIKVLRLGEFTNNTLTDVYQLTFHPIPYSKFKIGYLPRSRFPSEEILKFLCDYGQKNNVIFVKLEPYVKVAGPAAHQPQASLVAPVGAPRFASPVPLVKSTHPLFPEWTQRLVLTPSEDELMAKFKPKTRYNIRLAQKKGVRVSEMTNNDGFEIFAKLFFETTKRQKYFGHTKHYHKIVFETLKDKIAHILVAFYKDTPLSVFELFRFNDVLYYPYGGSSLEHRNLMAANLLMWEAIRFGKRLGCKIFDMWGSEAPGYSENSAWGGFSRFKEGYGTEFVHFVGTYDLVINNFAYKLYNTAHKARQIFLKLKK